MITEAPPRETEAAAGPSDTAPVRPIRVLFVNDHLGFADGVIHGPATWFMTVLPAFDRRRVEPHLCILRPWHPAADRLEALGAKPTFLGRSKFDPRALTDLARIVRERDIDVLHLLGMKGLLLGRVVAGMTGRPAVIHFRDTLAPKPWLRLLQRRLVGWTDAALAVSQPVRDLAIRDFGFAPERVEVLHNALDIDRFAHRTAGTRDRIRTEFGFAPSHRVIGAVGRVTDGKGQNALVRAFAALFATHAGARLLIVGDGPTRGALESLAAALGVAEAIRFAGFREDVPDILSALDIFAMPALWGDGLPHAVLEASAAGLPVVGFRFPGSGETIVENETGLVVERGDVDALHRVLARVLDDEALARRLGEGGRRHAENFTLAPHLARLEEIYRDVLRRKPRRMAEI